ncbi:MAG: sulfotransferase domain-containing protein [Kiritimatiellia bacterium]
MNLRPVINALVPKCFPLFRLFVLRPLWWWKCSTERRLSAGQQVSFSKKPSVLVFTVHRSGSTFLGRLLHTLVNQSDMVMADFDTFFALQEIPVREGFKDTDFINRVFSPEGYVYGPCRSFRDIPDVGRYRKLLLLRDPRDALVSKYYSIAYSHIPVSMNLLRRRRKALTETVDQFVLEEAEELRQKYAEYADKVLKDKKTLYCRFEDMMSKPSDFLERLQEFMEIHLPRREIKKLLGKQMKPPAKEDIYRHRRSGKTGGYRAKLTPATISQLNHIFGNLLETFGYSA